MNSLVILCVVIAVTGCSGNTVQLSDAQKERATQNMLECIKESGVKAEILSEAKKGNFVDDENIKKFTLCFFKKAGIVDADGKLNVATALAKLPPGVDKDEAEKLLETCKSKTGKDAADTAYETLKCYHQGTKTHIFLGF